MNHDSETGLRVTKRWCITAAATTVIVTSILGMAAANGQPTPPAPVPPGPSTSTTDELADMVMDVIEGGAPTTTVPAPHP